MNKKILFIILFLVIISLVIIFFFIKKEEPVVEQSFEGRVLNVYNWEDYLSEEVIENFEKMYGVTVKLDTFEDSDDVLFMLREDSSRYDLVIADDDYVEYFIKMRLLQKINKDSISNLKNIDRKLISGSFDEEMEYCVPYTSGYTGVMINPQFVEEYDDLRDVFWNEKYKGKVTMVNNAAEILINAAYHLGYDPNNITIEELKNAEEKALELKDMDVLFGDPVQQREWIVSEDAWVGYLYSTEVVFIQEEKEDVNFFAPKEGAHLWSDSICITKDAKNKDVAELFLNYLLEIEVMAKNSEDIYALMPGIDIERYIDEEILEEIRGLDFPKDEEILRKSTYVNYFLREDVYDILSNITRELKIRE
jgi:spermidine/putrescine transport system substrate-binding protein